MKVAIIFSLLLYVGTAIWTLDIGGQLETQVEEENSHVTFT